ncbi:hypothetical protein [Anaerostipes sp.]|uniref:hypothetical protein n=1 Tax=Anaerostipes sp. TaxID=1872530 RepID=UPI0025C299DD|nr:hypothetical protein [Anaerostipes sp.]MBS7007231.1 DUF1298 domain-containing protein [Anaerostipes sp.]
MKKREDHIAWRKLDNTAQLFPVIANKEISHVYRISATLKEEIRPELLQRALEDILPWFDVFRVRLRRGFFWFYFEENKNRPEVEDETEYPCRYIDPHGRRKFLFRVSYYRRRINLEVFHAVSDGMGAVTFLKELTYRYIDLCRSRGVHKVKKYVPSEECILDQEDSYIKHYRKKKGKSYSTKKAYQIKGRKLYGAAISVIHGYVSIGDLKKVCRKYGVSVTKYLTAVMIYSIYEEYMNKQKEENPVCINLPVNLRAFFDSSTTSNFFAVTMIEFLSKGDGHTFQEILSEVSRQMDEKITKEKIEDVLAYNVSAEKNRLIRVLPLFMKNLGLSYTFRRSSKSATTTLSNLGQIKVLKEYEAEIEKFHVMMGVFKTQEIKCAMLSYQDQAVITFTSVFQESYLQKAFFRNLTREGIKVSIESNGVINEKV